MILILPIPLSIHPSISLSIYPSNQPSLHLYFHPNKQTEVLLWWIVFVTGHYLYKHQISNNIFKIEQKGWYKLQIQTIIFRIDSHKHLSVVPRCTFSKIKIKSTKLYYKVLFTKCNLYTNFNCSCATNYLPPPYGPISLVSTIRKAPVKHLLLYKIVDKRTNFNRAVMNHDEIISWFRCLVMCRKRVPY